MTVYDVFMMNNEIDMIDIRLNILKDLVDVFIVMESKYTFSGREKPLYFETVMDKYTDIEFIYIVVDVPHKTHTFDRKSRRQNLYAQRDSIVEYNDKTKIFKPNDIILINDIDEIPKPEYLKKLIDTGRQEKIRFKQKFYYFYLNYRCGNDWTQGTVFIRGKDFTTFSKIRMDNTIEMIVDGGWHFSYMEDPQDKIANLVETEFDLEKFKTNKWLEEIKKTPKDIFNRNIEWYWETDVNDLPMYIKQNLNKYEKFIGVSE